MSMSLDHTMEARIRLHGISRAVEENIVISFAELPSPHLGNGRRKTAEPRHVEDRASDTPQDDPETGTDILSEVITDVGQRRCCVLFCSNPQHVRHAECVVEQRHMASCAGEHLTVV